ncbi:hypothetical protein F5884DRAFT_113948 [Xylogone sp. PMI_703]|nr:hypothetical protein F5884DRAFT_113948 [Xylogone sp. PMI_703]
MATNNLPTTIRALWQGDHKQPTHITLTKTTLPVPKPGTDEHLIRVHAAVITSGELFWPIYFPPPNPEKEPVPVYDIAGTVITAPQNSPFKPGDEIYARTNFYRTGSGREYTIATTEELALRPKNISWAEAASIPMSAQTAWQALFEKADLRPEPGVGGAGKRIFVAAASGAVGQWLVQLAHWIGAEVLASCGSSNVEHVKSLGAKEVISRGTDIKQWAASNAKADIVYDCYGKETLADAWWLVKDDGLLISIVQPPEDMKPAELEDKKVNNFFFIVKPIGAHLEQITKGVEENRFVPTLDSVYPLEKFEEAFAKVESGRTRGKVALDMGVN